MRKGFIKCTYVNPLYNLIIIWEYDKYIIVGQQLSEDSKINDLDDNVNNLSEDIKTDDNVFNDVEAIDDTIVQDIKTYDVLQLPRTYCPIILKSTSLKSAWS